MAATGGEGNHQQRTITTAPRDYRDDSVTGCTPIRTRLSKHPGAHEWDKLTSSGPSGSAVSTLPSEILVIVFTFTAAAAPTGSSTTRRVDPRIPRSDHYPTQIHPGRKLGWIVATHVCRRWRQVALQSPRLWCRVTLAIGVTWTRTFILRARPIPLSISFTHPLRPSDSQEDIGELGEYFSRASDLHLEEGIASRFQNNHSQLPLLRSLVLHSTGCDPFAHHLFLKPAISPKPHRFPVALHAAHAPKLRAIRLHGYVPTLSSPLFRFYNLTHVEMHLPLELHIDDINERRDLLPSRDDFFDLLERAPFLSVLKWRGLLPDLWSRPQSRSVSLPALTSLALGGFCKECTAVLHYLLIPSTAKLDISVVTEGPADIYPLLLKVGAHFASSSQLLLTGKAGIPYRGATQAEITAWRTHLPTRADGPAYPEFEPPGEPDLFLEMQCQMVLGAALALLDILLKALPLVALHTLAVDLADGCPVRFGRWWSDTFRRFRDVRHLRVERATLMGFCLSEIAAMPPGEITEVTFPELRSLTVRGTQVAEESSQNRFRDALAARAKKGAGLQTVYIEGGQSLKAEWLSGLTKWVERVDIS
ncbi:hypothetical protein BC834DRAFT_1034275 [Gloeopeniophorella convolvens]|nr:hypothetical protein BC834DRAFT_1034275 [Gloeopeniophorella convolvens]